MMLATERMRKIQVVAPVPLMNGRFHQKYTDHYNACNIAMYCHRLVMLDCWMNFPFLLRHKTLLLVV